MSIIFKSNKFSAGFRKKKWCPEEIVSPDMEIEEYFRMPEKKHFDAVNDEAKEIEKKYYKSIERDKYAIHSLEDLRAAYLSKYKKEVCSRYKNDNEWIKKELNKED